MNGLAVVLSDAEAPARLSVESTPLGNKSQWTGQEIVFETPAETRVLRLQIVRRPVEMIYDYIKGKVWFDSLTLDEMDRPTGQRVNGSPGQRVTGSIDFIDFIDPLTY